MIKVIMLMIVLVLVVLLFEQLPDYMMIPYSNYIAYAIVGGFAALIYIVSKK